MEIGSFIELQFPEGKEYYSQKTNIARLNSGRAAIWHAFRVLGCKAIWLPYYQCDTVGNFLRKKNVSIKYYQIDNSFTPIDLFPSFDEAVLLVNYFGVMSSERISSLAQGYKNVIIDNSQAFFSPPLDNCMNVYSCRKFIGVPDGSYVIGKNAELYTEEYQQCYSSDTALFLLQRIEYGCEGRAYQSKELNEFRIDAEDCKCMSKLTRTILDGTDYGIIIKKRRENFQIARKLFDNLNNIDASRYTGKVTVPMVYPLVICDDGLMKRLHSAKHFQGHWWSYICNNFPDKKFECWLSRYIIPLTIDQRYGKEELMYIYKIISNI